MVLFRLTIFLLITSLAPSLAEVTTRSQAADFLASLNAEQMEECLLDRKHKDRWGMRYTGGGYRPGLVLSDLNGAQRKKLDVLLRQVLSEKGLAKAKEVAAQDGEDLERMVVAFFGDPRISEDYAWRVGEHHFTIVHVGMKGDVVQELGPILLGSNPYGPWDRLEQAYLDLYTATAGQVAVVKRAGIASRKLGEEVGLDIRELTSGADQQVSAVLKEMVSLFSDDMAKTVRDVFNREAASEEGLRLAFFSEEPREIGRKGGRWDAKFGNSRFLMDLELSRGHNHMSLWLRQR